MSKGDGLTPKQRRFIEEYLKDLNGMQSAIRAGYSAKTAVVQGSRLLTNAKVRQAIEIRQARRAQKAEITQDMVLAELAKIGFADIRRAVKWGSEITANDAETGEATIASGVALIDSKEIDDSTAAAISEISQTQAGIKIKLHDKRAALIDIGKHIGMFNVHSELDAQLKRLEIEKRQVEIEALRKSIQTPEGGDGANEEQPVLRPDEQIPAKPVT